jgi:hypothetical protein
LSAWGLTRTCIYIWLSLFSLFPYLPIRISHLYYNVQNLEILLSKIGLKTSL